MPHRDGRHCPRGEARRSASAQGCARPVDHGKSTEVGSPPQRSRQEHIIRRLASSSRALSCLVVLFGASFFLGVTASDAQGHRTPNYWGASYKACGAFETTYHTHVYAKGIRCPLARRIQKEYWDGPARFKVIVNGGSGANGYVRLRRFPGWICRSGSGGGACTKQKKAAAYSNFAPTD